MQLGMLALVALDTLAPAVAFADDQVGQPLVAPVVAAHDMKTTGMGLTLTGIGLELAGAGLMIGAVAADPCIFAIGLEGGRCSGHSGGGLFFAGVGIAVIADLFIVSGVPIWVIGAKRERRLRAATSGQP
jgi:hypothetical protein